MASGSGWNLLCGVVRRYINFLILLIPTPLVYVLFLQQHPYFKKKNCFSFFFQYFFVIKFYVYIKYFLRSINTHTGNYGRPTAAI